jgi:hypothetical protein
MTLEELQEKLIELIKIRMSGKRSVIDVPLWHEFAVHELCFLIELLEVIDTEESKDTIEYIKKLIVNGNVD